MAFAEPVTDSRLVKHSILSGGTACLFLRPLLKGGLQCIDRSDDYGLGLS